ncbi:Asp-tRNA(Asn)/Glu-tRNA(Gln) amidotransferase subunit GatC [Haloimpatiens sp. FM7315]|uniref:Asp-tRNA(Asn)/Glu-tRNA(Gln) amidotransferase subunit GatC n=1 Tax=Haloimpatiens sp. FM7315 TaxID=3298609 RepID=UPI0035A3A891
MAISKKDVEYVAKLSKIHINEDEKDEFIKDFNDILNYMEILNGLDTENIEPLTNPYYIDNKFREDEVLDSMSPKEVFRNSKDRYEEYFIVPKVIEK